MSGLGKLAAYGVTTANIASVGLPLLPLCYTIAVVFEIGSGPLLLLGFRSRQVWLASAFTLATALFFHHTGLAAPDMGGDRQSRIIRGCLEII
jgi:putative oxidoreductase